MNNPWQGAADWLRNNYQDHANVASLCDAMLEASTMDHADDNQISSLLRVYANNNEYSHADYADVMLQAADEIERLTKPDGEPVAYLNLKKLEAGGMCYATKWKTNDVQSAIYAVPVPDAYWKAIADNQQTRAAKLEARITELEAALSVQTGHASMWRNVSAKQKAIIDAAKNSLTHINCESINAEWMSQDALDSICSLESATTAQPVAQDELEAITERIRLSAGSFTGKGKIELHKEVEHLLGHIALLKSEQARASLPVVAVPEGKRP